MAGERLAAPDGRASGGQALEGLLNTGSFAEVWV